MGPSSRSLFPLLFSIFVYFPFLLSPIIPHPLELLLPFYYGLYLVAQRLSIKCAVELPVNSLENLHKYSRRDGLLQAG
jgi:hypothetical protein